MPFYEERVNLFMCKVGISIPKNEYLVECVALYAVAAAAAVFK
jgi:hypothetical protein